MSVAVLAIARVLARNNYQTCESEADSAMDEIRVRHRFAVMFPEEARLELDTPYERSYYYYLVRISNADEIVAMLRAVCLEGGDISPYVVAEDATTASVVMSLPTGGESKTAASTESPQDDEIRARQARAEEVMRQQREQREAEERARHARAQEALRQQREQQEAQERARQAQRQRDDADRLRREQEAEARSRQQREEAERLRREREERERKKRQQHELPQPIRAVLVRAKSALEINIGTVHLMFETFVERLLALENTEYQSAENEWIKTVCIYPLSNVLYEHAAALEEEKHVKWVILLVDMILAEDFINFLDSLHGLEQSFPKKAPPRPAAASNAETAFAIDVPRRSVPCVKPMTMNNLTYYSLSCPYETLMTGLFKVCETSITEAVRGATQLYAAANVSGEKRLFLHNSILQIMDYLQGRATNPSRNVDSFRLRENFRPLLNDNPFGMLDARELLTALARFYNFRVRYEQAIPDTLPEPEDPTYDREPQTMIVHEVTNAPGADDEPIEYGNSYATPTRMFNGHQYRLMACFCRKTNYAHWISYVNDPVTGWHVFDGHDNLQARIVDDKPLPLTVTHGVKNLQTPMAWIYVPLQGPAPSLAQVRDLLANIEHEPAYSSPDHGLHYDAIESQLLPVLADAYTRQESVIEASPRLKEALEPLTQDGGSLQMGGPENVARDIRYLHWMSVAAELLDNPMDTFIRERCVAERPPIQ